MDKQYQFYHKSLWCLQVAPSSKDAGSQSLFCSCLDTRWTTFRHCWKNHCHGWDRYSWNAPLLKFRHWGGGEWHLDVRGAVAECEVIACGGLHLWKNYCCRWNEQALRGLLHAAYRWQSRGTVDDVTPSSGAPWNDGIDSGWQCSNRRLYVPNYILYFSFYTWHWTQPHNWKCRIGIEM